MKVDITRSVKFLNKALLETLVLCCLILKLDNRQIVRRKHYTKRDETDNGDIEVLTIHKLLFTFKPPHKMTCNKKVKLLFLLWLPPTAYSSVNWFHCHSIKMEKIVLKTIERYIMFVIVFMLDDKFFNANACLMMLQWSCFLDAGYPSAS